MNKRMLFFEILIQLKSDVKRILHPIQIPSHYVYNFDLIENQFVSQ